MATRIIVKNLPPYLTQDAFTKHFSDYSSPTDSKLQTSKSGKSRRFGFVGFQSITEAESAVQHWNNTYVGSTKINAELARTVEEESATNYKRKRPAEDAVAAAQSAKQTKRRKSNEIMEENDPKFREFLRLNEKRSKSRTFLNDDEEFVQQAAVEEEPDVIETQDDMEYEPIPQKPVEEYVVIDHEPLPVEASEPIRVAVEVPQDADDAEWLRNRTSRILDLTDGTEEQMPRTNLISSAQTHSMQPIITDKSKSVSKIVPQGPVMAPVKSEEELKAERAASDAAAKVEAIKTIKDTARLFLRNLAFTVDEAALKTLFENYGGVQEVHIPQSANGTPKGNAYIHFDRANDAIAAYQDLDGKSFHGRLLHILPGQAKITIEKPQAPGAKLNVGDKRKEERRKEAAKSRFNWNSLFLNQDAVMENTAKKFGVSKSELLDASQSSAAVTMALAESSALNTIKKFFLSHGVNLQSFSQTRQKDDSILLFKNLPSHANEGELTKLVEGAGGVIRRIVIPDIGGLAIVEVVDGNQGKSVFGKLAYRKFGDGLIYLEKGPVNTFTSAVVPEKSTGKGEDTARTADASDDSDASTEMERATVFVKNLNFETRAPELTKVFESLKGFRQATVKTKPNPKEPGARLSMGFGFVEFANEADARTAINTMQGFSLDAHALTLSLSTGKSTDRKTQQGAAAGTAGTAGTKVIVKNLPFETTRGDVARLFGTYGSIKSIRVPKKYNAHLRGFAFLEFVSKREAKNAIEALEGTHLLGRRLVIQYAEAELRGDEGVDQLVQKTRSKRVALERAEGGRRKVGKVNLDGTEADAFE
ncbi:Multiple RNA-binding domain-containing protein [Taphrina deformans PYCC 5710]|uniref:Multiple RNA-binding domain-containing protein n=1 Tax=Taphrina deformans (strain PYCC 5710 / ATCC 11124 / CBS 356.35 / IMI 108563 / JCM 9778 / NBRC 8474) TaxID=1097556 RepID=R4XFZ9_TAPDE|nr:Multiple RNA-binding domain-containing protein [Taphrina deformans PYCC 5710]|eukprot:CCG83424.1 Multiple RNA-binding domain-containing protein [Taphrina deformans PYCC 5710]